MAFPLRGAAFALSFAPMKTQRIAHNIDAPETKKARAYYMLSSVYEVTVFSFLTLFLAECRANLGWEDWMSSLSLFLPPFTASVSIFFSSFFVGHHTDNLKAMRVLTLSSFALLIAFSLCGLLLPSHGSDGGVNVLLYFVLVIGSSLLMGAHWSFLSFQISNAADINYVEKTRFGQVYLFVPLISMAIAPLAGFTSNSIFHHYQGYLFLFLIASPLLLLEFAGTFFFHSYDPKLFHDEADEKTSYRRLFSNHRYCLYLFVVVLWVSTLWASDAMVSGYWASLESSSEAENSFNGLAYGFYLAFSYLLDFIVVYFNTRIGFGKRTVFSVNLGLGVLVLASLGFGLLSYFFRLPPEEGLYLMLSVIALHGGKGIANGLYYSSNLSIIHHLLGSKLRRKAVFLAPCLYQLINAFLQLVYPFLGQNRYIGFFLMAGASFLGFVLSWFLDGPLLHQTLDARKASTDQGEDAFDQESQD